MCDHGVCVLQTSRGRTILATSWDGSELNGKVRKVLSMKDTTAENFQDRLQESGIGFVKAKRYPTEPDHEFYVVNFTNRTLIQYGRDQKVGNPKKSLNRETFAKLRKG